MSTSYRRQPPLPLRQSSAKRRSYLVYVWSREHLGELNVRPLPQALPTHDVVAENHILRERLEIPSLQVYMMQRKKRHMGESKENYSSGGIHVHTRS